MTNLRIKDGIKTMTREEQIREASIDYQLSTNPRAIGGDAFAEFAREMNVNPSFIAGAKWADNNPSQKALAKELHRLGYTITLNSDIVPRAEEEKAVKSYIEYQKSQFIEKACEWLEKHVEDFMPPTNSLHDYNIGELILFFKKAMEE